MKLDDLKRDPNNARKRGDQAASTLAGSLAEFGAARSIVIDADGIIRAGNGTVEAAKAAGITKAKIVKGKPDELIVVQRSDLKGQAAKAYAIADNRTSELAEWDIEELGSQLDSLTEFDLVALGFTEGDLESLFQEFDVEPIDAPGLASGDREPIQQMTFTVSDEQAEVIKSAIKSASGAGPFVDTGNENSNGNALGRIAEAYVGQG